MEVRILSQVRTARKKLKYPIFNAVPSRASNVDEPWPGVCKGNADVA